jgi:hypothetical protein
VHENSSGDPRRNHRAASRISLRDNTHEFPDINLNAGAYGLLGGENLAGDLLRHARFAAIGARFGWDGLEDQRRAFSLEGHGGEAGPSPALRRRRGRIAPSRRSSSDVLACRRVAKH